MTIPVVEVVDSNRKSKGKQLVVDVVAGCAAGMFSNILDDSKKRLHDFETMLE